MTSSRRLLGSLTLVACLGGLLAVAPTGAAARPARPDLLVASGSVAPAPVTAGSPTKVGYVVRNAGRARAGRSAVQVDLVAGARAVRLATSTLPALAPRATRRGAVSARVPAATATGTYSVRVCADARRQVKESVESNNCRVVGSLRVTRKPTTPPVTPVPPVPQLPTMDPGTTQIDSFAATTTWPADESAAVAAIRSRCGLVHPARALTLSAALASLHTRLQSDAADGVRRLRASPAYGDVGKLHELAVAGTTQAVPGLALAALLRAAELEPSIATHLVDAAAIATSVGMPNEAIALLDAAAQRTYRKPAMGIPVQTIAAVVRGQALVMTGRLAEARPWFLAARHSAPVLTEADAGLATVEACSGRVAAAGRFVESSRVRTHTETPQGQAPVEIDPTEHVDLTKGRPTPLRNLPIGQTPTTLVGLRQTYLDVLNDVTGEVGRRQARVDAATTRLEAVDADSSIAERLRRSSLVWLGQSTTNARAEAIESEIEQVEDRLRTIGEEFWDEANDFHGPGTFPTIREDAVAACAGSQDRECARNFIIGQCRPALADAHGRWRSAMGRLDTLSAEHLDVVSRLRSSIAANLSEPSAHELVVLGIAVLERQHYDQLAHHALLWSSAAATFADVCVEPAPGTPDPTEDAPDVESEDPCTPGVAAIAFKTKLGPVEVKINCEKIQQEVSAEVLPLLFAFGEVSYDFRAGAITVVVGAKTKVGGDPLEGSFKSGAYVKVGKDGVQDVGWQVGPEVTSTAGKIELTTYKDEMDISFVPALSTGF